MDRCCDTSRLLDAMGDRSRREALRGSEVQIVDLIFEVLSPQQWVKFLQAPLERVAAKGDRDLAQRLIGARAEVGEALHEAVRGGHGGIVSDMLESRAAPISKKGRHCETPLHIAARQGDTEIVQLLLLKRADKDAFDVLRWTPLYLAAKMGHVAAALALLAAGADVNLPCGEEKTPVMHEAAAKGHVEILTAVIERGANVEAVDDFQETALHKAAAYGTVEAVNMLVDAGANIEARDSEGETPLHRASGNLRRESLLSLLKHGANINVQTNNSLDTPLIGAALSAGTGGAAEVVDSLLRAGADETLVDQHGFNAAELIAEEVAPVDRLAEDVEHVRELLTNAPADRAWRRRGYLVLCRAHMDRVHHNGVISDNHRLTGTARGTRKRANPAGAEGATRDSTVDESTGGEWTVVLAEVLRLQEEGIFRTIVGYL